MTDTEPIKDEVKSLEQEAREVHPVKRILLLDVLADKNSRLVFYWTAAFLLVGTLVYHWLEGWSYLDSLYFSLISMTTIGYGDLSPTTPASKVFTIIFAINGIAILLTMFDQIQTVRIRNRLDREDAAKRSGDD